MDLLEMCVKDPNVNYIRKKTYKDDLIEVRIGILTDCLT